jgi:hypothetical protein
MSWVETSTFGFLKHLIPKKSSMEPMYIHLIPKKTNFVYLMGYIHHKIRVPSEQP